MKAKRAALYLRVSTNGQDTANQREALEAVAAQRGWEIVATYDDNGVSGAKGRDKRPGLDALLKDGARGKFDVVMAWAIDRLGRSLTDLLINLRELEAVHVDLFIHQQNLDTTTPAGRLIFQVTGAFAEFERSLIVARVNAGLARARAETPEQRRAKGKQLSFGRPGIGEEREAAIRAALAAGGSIRKVAAGLGVSAGTVHGIAKRVRAEVG